MKKILTYVFLFFSCLAQAQLDAYNDTVTGKTGFTDSTGKLVIPCVFDGSDGFYNGTALCYNDSTHCLIDEKGKQLRIFPWGYPTRSKSKRGFYMTDYDTGEMVFYDSLGKEKRRISCNRFDEWAMSEGPSTVFVFLAGDTVGIITDDGDFLLPPAYELQSAWSYDFTFRWDGKLYFYENEYFYLFKDRKPGLVNVYGKILVPFEYDTIVKYAQDDKGNLTYALVKKNGKQMLLNSKCEKANTEFDTFIGHFSFYDKSKIVLMKDDKPYLFDCIKSTKADSFPATIKVTTTRAELQWGYDSIGNEIQFYDTIKTTTLHTEKYFSFSCNGRSMVIDHKGNVLFPLSDVGHITVLEYKGKVFFAVEEKGGENEALFDSKGKQLTKYQFSSISESEKGFTGRVGNYYEPEAVYEISLTGALKKID